MYCPNCGQQQVSEEMRFCSRCGLALSGLTEWLNGYRQPMRREEEVKVVPDPATPRYILNERGLGYRFVDFERG